MYLRGMWFYLLYLMRWVRNKVEVKRLALGFGPYLFVKVVKIEIFIFDEIEWLLSLTEQLQTVLAELPCRILLYDQLAAVCSQSLHKRTIQRW